MQIVEIRVAGEELADLDLHRQMLSQALGVRLNEITHLQLVRRSVDARKKPARFVLGYRVWLDEPYAPEEFPAPQLQNVTNAPEAAVVGFGPAGLFAALRLIELGIKPIVFERGKAVRERRRDIAKVTKEGVVPPDSNYCFGEGGAGTFSDGKLYTRSTKRGSVDRILAAFVHFGAEPDIRIDTHPHIGTNKLPGIIQTMREAIIACGGEVHFNSRIAGFAVESGVLRGVTTADGITHRARAVVLATGHSARDIFALLERQQIEIQAKPFALGVRVEHAQSFVDQAQYRVAERGSYLPAASYALREQVDGRGVFSFCMCPGGIICPAATSDGEIVVNGWSPSKRNSKYANSGIVVEVTAEDLRSFGGSAPSAGIRFQQQIEQAAFAAGGGKQVAPAQRLTDLIAGRASTTVPECSYIPGLAASDLAEVFPKALFERLVGGLAAFDRKLKGYVRQDAVAVAVESRTSSPIRIPRNPETGMHPGVEGLFPAGEGAGYAGGIVSAAIDGEVAAQNVARFLLSTGQ